MEDNLEKEIDRSVITDYILLEIIPISDEKFGGSREIALENAKKAYVHFKTGFKRFMRGAFNEKGFAKMFDNPISIKATASLIRLNYSVHTLTSLTKDDTEYLKKEAQIFSETSELMNLYHEHLFDEKLNEDNDDYNEKDSE
jgi:hypothetical protein